MTHILATADILDRLANIAPDSALAAARLTRDAATQHIQGSYRALFTVSDGHDFTLPERLAVAHHVAIGHGDSRLAAFYAAQSETLAPPGDSSKLTAGLAHAQRLTRQPASASAGQLEVLRRVGWSPSAIVTLSQLVAYISFQSRLLLGYRLMGQQPITQANAPVAVAGVWRTAERTHGGRPAPSAFTQRQLGWEPWLAVRALKDFTAEQQAILVHNGHGDSDYFRLLAHNLPVLEQRTLTDQGIFYTSGGLARKERELAATVASKVNGCIYCASVHARKASQLSKQTEAVQRLIDTPPGGVLAAGQSPRWQALIDFAAALSTTPASANPEHITRLRELELTDLELLDLVQSTAFFAWANRLMLTLGEPFDDHVPT